MTDRKSHRRTKKTSNCPGHSPVEVAEASLVHALERLLSLSGNCAAMELDELGSLATVAQRLIAGYRQAAKLQSEGKRDDSVGLSEELLEKIENQLQLF